MEKWRILLSLFFALALVTGCTSQQANPSGGTSSSASWAYPEVVYNGDTYKVTTDEVTNIGKEIGEVTYSSDKEGDYSGNFSNKFPVGTKYYEILGIGIKKSIAVKVADDSYLKADYQGKYGTK